MTKEELKQEAEEKCVCTDEAMRIMYRIGYIDCAEPREKRIAELEDKLANADYQLEGRDIKIKELEAQVEKMKSIGRTSYIKGIRTMANALKDYDSTDGAWTDYFEHTVDKVLKKLLKEIKEND